MWSQPILVQVLHDDREQEIRDHLARQTHDTLTGGMADSAAPANQQSSIIARILHALALHRGRIQAQPGSPGFRSVSRMF